MNYELIVPLAEFIIKAIATRPENRLEDGTPNWNFISADVYLDYEGEFNDDMIEDAIDLIIEAAESAPTLH